MNESLNTLSSEQLRRAADVVDQLESLKAELANILGGVASESIITDGTQRRKISAAGLARIRAAQTARWAKAKAAVSGAETKPKRRMSAAAKARLAVVARARWRKAKAAGKTRL